MHYAFPAYLPCNVSLAPLWAFGAIGIYSGTACLKLWERHGVGSEGHFSRSNDGSAVAADSGSVWAPDPKEK